MKIKKLFMLMLLPFLITGCDFNFELYDPNDSSLNSGNNTSIDGKDINVINPSNYQGTINYAPSNQTLLSKEQVYENCLTSTVYILSIVDDGYVLGSGVFFSEDNSYGYIFTNAHVVEGTKGIEVVYSNSKRSKAKLIGYNLLEDVAVLAVEKNNNYTIATLQTSDNLSPGMEVLAIGTPSSTEFRFSANSGIISRIDSPISSVFDDSYELLLIQTDTPINNGNSGGPLFDMYGNLIGLNSMKLIYDDSLNSIDDINFSIPMERAAFMANSFFTNRPYTRGKIGITINDIIDLSIDQREEYGINRDYGLLVLESSNSNFKVNDIIVEINGIEFTSKTQFQKELYNHYINENITFKVYRNGSYVTVNASLK